VHEKRGEQSKPVNEKQSSQSDVLFVTRPSYTTLVRRLPGNYSYQIASDLTEGGSMVSNNTYLAVITDDSSIVRKAAEKGIPFIFLEYNPKSVHMSMAERNPHSYCLDPTKKSFTTEFTLSVDEMLSSYKQTEHETQEERTITPIKVLIVEYEPSNLLLYKQKFEDQGYEVRTADSEKSAISIVREGGIDAVITDFELPESPSGGLHVLQTVMLDSPNTPLIIHTGHHSERILSAVRELGVYEIVTKSSDSPKKLVDLVGKALGLSPISDGTLDRLAEEVDEPVPLVREVKTPEAEEVTERLEAALEGQDVIVKKFDF
jgi:CheY-like chemotaxis protein